MRFCLVIHNIFLCVKNYTNLVDNYQKKSYVHSEIDMKQKIENEKSTFKFNVCLKSGVLTSIEK